MITHIYQYLLVLLLILLLPVNGLTCSTFVLKSDHLQVFGRNYDWNFDDALVLVNKRGCTKTSTNRPKENGQKVAWTAKYGSITFNQYGRELPMGGMNEVGLVVEAMALSDTRYPEPDDRPYLGSASQWRQYLLDTCATVAEVVASDKKIRISNKSSGPGTHVLVLDKTGGSAAVEFLDGRMKVHTGKDLPVAVLTNDTYAKSLRCLQDNSLPFFDAYRSINRFITAAKRNQRCQAETTDQLVEFAFVTLAAVASARTQWRIVYDNKDMRVHFRTKANYELRYMNFSDFDFSPETPVKILDINADFSGDVTGQFSDYTYKANRNLISLSYRQTSFLSQIPDERLDAIARFPENFKCP
jgi:penicillin V acylase-like amidase (Ntn superfamily)